MKLILSGGREDIQSEVKEICKESPVVKKSSKETLLFLFVPKQLEEEDHSFNP